MDETVSHNRSKTPYRPCQTLMDTHTCTNAVWPFILIYKRRSSITINPSTRTTKAGSVFWRRRQKETKPTFTPFVARSKLKSTHACANLPNTSASGSCHHTPPDNRQTVSAQTSLSAVFVGMRPDCMQMIYDDLLCFLLSRRSTDRNIWTCDVQTKCSKQHFQSFLN